MDGIQKLDKNKNYYVYCHSGVRSVQACQIMKSFGFENLYNLLGGISEWTGQKAINVTCFIKKGSCPFFY